MMPFNPTDEEFPMVREIMFFVNASWVDRQGKRWVDWREETKHDQPYVMHAFINVGDPDWYTRHFFVFCFTAANQTKVWSFAKFTASRELANRTSLW